MLSGEAPEVAPVKLKTMLVEVLGSSVGQGLKLVSVPLVVPVTEPVQIRTPPQVIEVSVLEPVQLIVRLDKISGTASGLFKVTDIWVPLLTTPDRLPLQAAPALTSVS